MKTKMVLSKIKILIIRDQGVLVIDSLEVMEAIVVVDMVEMLVHIKVAIEAEEAMEEENKEVMVEVTAVVAEIIDHHEGVSEAVTAVEVMEAVMEEDLKELKVQDKKLVIAEIQDHLGDLMKVATMVVVIQELEADTVEEALDPVEVTDPVVTKIEDRVVLEVVQVVDYTTMLIKTGIMIHHKPKNSIKTISPQKIWRR